MVPYETFIWTQFVYNLYLTDIYVAGWMILSGSIDKNKIINIPNIYDIYHILLSIRMLWLFIEKRQKIQIGLLDV